MPPLLELRNVVTSYPVRTGLLQRVTSHIHAVSDVTMAVDEGETLGVVGESGCGKSTLARTIVGLQPVHAGTISFEGRDITRRQPADRRALAREIQMVFQDPFASLNPRMKVKDLLETGWRVNDGVVPPAEWRRETDRLLTIVGLDPSDAQKFPHQFSGGQRQRIGIARALSLRPRLIVCDEPVSALDVSIQAQIINLLQDLQAEFGLALVFIAHDLAVVRHVAHRVAVMYLGKIVEHGDREVINDRPSHPYTQALLSAAPHPEPWEHPERRRIVLTGDVPNPADPPSGCRFRTRCWKAQDVCASDEPELQVRDGADHPCACHFAAVSPGVTA